jgi:hypothetical protein
VARFCTWILILLFAVVSLVRFALFRHRWFILSGAAVLHAVLDGLVGLPYLVAGVIAAVLAAAATGFVAIRSSRAGGGR